MILSCANCHIESRCTNDELLSINEVICSNLTFIGKFLAISNVWLFVYALLSKTCVTTPKCLSVALGSLGELGTSLPSVLRETKTKLRL